MTEAEITSQIIQALATYLKRDPSTITDAHHLRDDLGLDSVAIIELLFEIEDRFKIQIPDQDLPSLSTVGSVAAYVHRRLTGSEATPAAPETKPSVAPPKPAAVPKKPVAAARKRPAATSIKPDVAKKKPAATPVKRAAASKKVSAKTPVTKSKKR
ncbi:MAG: phosphopantetheine-binding protein [Nitrospira sp.]|nr:phosphopantetheine-binding protein [Nitrospira sp.]MCP9464749.1 phosphopantetheine-binding protein [Nitrospira sp.]